MIELKKDAFANMSLNVPRCRRLIDNVIETLCLDLSGLVVLTEAATNHFGLTPLIAALAGADRVIAVGRDSRFGSLESVKTALLSHARAYGVEDRLIISGDRQCPGITEADVITNLGFVRPLDAAFLARLKSSAVVALMWETWEFRSQDLDIQECRRLGIPVLGTNEEHPDLQIFTYLGHVALKLLFELDVEVFRSRISVVGTGKFAYAISEVLRRAGAESVDVISPSIDMKRHVSFLNADAILFVEHLVPDSLLGSSGWLDPEWLKAVNPSVSVAHICGNVDQESIVRAGIRHVPSHFADQGFMSVTTDYVGPRPLIDLHAAGLKVGEMLARRRLAGMSAFEAELDVLKTSQLAQGFSGVHANEGILP